MGKRLGSSLAFLLLFVAAAAGAHYPATLKIGEAAKKQPPVTFDHAKHGDTLVKSCGTCHHTQKTLTKAENAANKVDVKKCSTCHLDPKDAKIPSMREMSPTKNPFHIRCVSCHKTEKKGPVACTGCHKKST
ncbi:MAG TPA: cytochrome c3 family protein [Thermoanaerobaculia bacterium]